VTVPELIVTVPELIVTVPELIVTVPGIDSVVTRSPKAFANLVYVMEEPDTYRY
jgi:hypothetical protein